MMVALGVMVLLLMACGQTSRTSDEKSIAATIANQVRATLTAEAQKQAANTAVAVAPSDTPEPTKTPAPTATSTPTDSTRSMMRFWAPPGSFRLDTCTMTSTRG